MFKYFYSLIIISSFILASAIACNHMETEPTIPEPEPTADNDLSSIIVSGERMALYADLTGYDLIETTPATRSSDASKTLESMLDRKHRTEKYIKGIQFIEIPILDEDRYASYGDKQKQENEQATIIRKFLITTRKPTKTNTFVATLICSKQYEISNPGFTYTNKRNFTGISLISKLDGTLTSMRQYSAGRIDIVKPLKADSDAINIEGIQYLNYFITTPGTRSDDGLWGGTITPSRCIAFGYQWINPSYCIAQAGGGYNPYSSGYYESLNGIYNYLEQSLESLGITGEEPSVTVLVASNTEDVAIQGSGLYGDGDIVTIYPVYIPNDYVTAPGNEPKFDHWVGSFGNISVDSFIFIIHEDINSVAYYNNGDLPCQDIKNNRSNPLVDMKIAPSSSWNIRGGTFGMTRIDPITKEPALHQGIDLYAEPGTPIYATHEGDIVFIKTDAPDYYVKKSFGNEIDIESTVTDPITGKQETRYFQYAHLQYGNPIAYNYREGRPFQNGDHVYQGELIGYAGRTGNATSVPNPHLHFGVGKQLRSGWIDPKNYLNGTFDTNFKSTNIESIRCDSGSDIAVDADDGNKPDKDGIEDVVDPDIETEEE